MLKKLIKNEFKESYKEMLILYGISLVAAIAFACLILLKNFEMLIISILPLVGIAISIEIFLAININRSFNKRLFSKEGYLTLSIPVKISKILLSKYFVNIIWILASFIMIIIDIIVVILISGDIGLDIFNIEIEYVGTTLLAVIYYFSLVLIAIIMLLTIVLLILCFLNIGKIKKHKILIGVLMFYGFTQVTSIFYRSFNIIPYEISFADGEINFYKVDVGFLEFSTLNMMLFMIIFTTIGIILVRHFVEKQIEIE